MKNEFINVIKDQLTSLEYIQDGEDKFYREIPTRRGGQTIIINGQRMEQNPQIIMMKKCVEFHGDGYIENEDGSNREDFTLIKVSIYLGEELIREFEEVLYWSDLNKGREFMNLINNL